MLHSFDQVGAVGLSLLHIALAVGVTLHVLFNKRDVAASVGWIGLAWLSPIFGSVLYLLFGINRVKRRANQLRDTHPFRPAIEQSSSAGPSRDDHLAAFVRAGYRITQRPTEDGNTVTVLHNGDEAYPQMLAAIDAAQHSAVLSTYLFRADVVGRAFIDAFARANRRGVQVRVLIDSIGSGYFLSPAYWQLRRRGVKVVRFMHSPLPWRMPFINLRTHKKLLVVDGAVAFMGGLNIGDENVLLGKPRHPVRDTHFRLEGPIVGQLTEVFAEDWLFASAENLSDEAWASAPGAAGSAMARAVVSGPDENIQKIESLILEAIFCAQHTIKIMTPYFLPDDRLITALALASMRGVEVALIVPARGNHPIVDSATRSQVGPLLAAGCQVWQNPPPFEHSKLMTVDGMWAFIGSANWDMRSFRLNFELNMEVYDSNLVEQLNALMATKQRLPLTAAELDARSFPVRLFDNAARLMLPYL
ncbi:MAG TPA: cardiolipin synthase [Xanthobacteraceae bacterium]|nr:cardiolipin synthase [Xanthobacteraceae bacterium]